MPDRYGDPSDIEQYESAAAAAEDLAADTDALALYYWTGDQMNKLEKITGCMIDTPQMDHAAGEVGAAYRRLSDALRSYRAAARKALNEAAEEAGRHA